MWPGRPPARSSTSRAARLDPLPRPEQHGRVEVPLHAAVVPDLLPARVERDAPVEADHVAARARPSHGSSVAVPVPKWIVGTSTEARIRADQGATNSS